MAVTASFQADFSSFTAAVDKSVLKLKGLETGSSRVEKALARVGDSFSGRRIIQDATLAAKAVEDIGGATKLTANEQARLNAVVTEAIAKYRALGQQAPQSLVAMANATKQVEQQTTLTQKAMAGLTGTLGQVAAGFGIASLVTSGARALSSFASEAISASSALVDASSKTGLTTDSLQQMKFAAEQTGGSLEDFTAAAFKLGVNLSGGSGSVKTALKSLGLSFEELRSLSPDEQFARIASALGTVGDAAERNRLGVALFGKAFASVAAAIGEGYDTLIAKAPIAGAAQVKALDDAGDGWLRLKARVVSSVTDILGQQYLQIERGAEWAKRVEAMTMDQRKAYYNSTQTAKEYFDTLDKALAQMDEKDRARSGARQAQTEAIASYSEQLKLATADAQSLSKAQRDELNAALELGVASASDLQEQFFRVDGALQLYQKQQKDAAEATKSHDEMLMRAADDLDKYAEKLQKAADELDRFRRASDDPVEDPFAGLAVGTTPLLDAQSGLTPQQQRELMIGSAGIGGFVPRVDIQKYQKQARQILTIWQEMTLQMVDSTANAFGDMLAGLRSFRDGAVDIWRGLQSSVSGLISNIVKQWVLGVGVMGNASPAIGGGLLGGGGGLAASAMGGGGGGGVAVSGGGGGFGGGFNLNGTGVGAFQRYGQGAIAGGIAGFSSGYASGSKAAGVGSGALTGALTGFSYGGWQGAAVGAGVGAAAGLFGASLGKDKNRDQVDRARQDWFSSVGGPYGAMQLSAQLGVGQPGHEAATSQWQALTGATTFDQLNRAIGQLQGILQMAANQTQRTPMGSRGGVPFYKDEAFGLTKPHLAVVGDAREPENVVKDSTLRRLSAGGSSAAIDRLVSKLDRYISDQPRAMRLAFTDALVLAGRA